MSTVLSLLLIAAAFGLGVWWGAHAAHVAGAANPDPSAYLANPPHRTSQQDPERSRTTSNRTTKQPAAGAIRGGQPN